jgi:hypothetical protein
MHLSGARCLMFCGVFGNILSINCGYSCKFKGCTVFGMSRMLEAHYTFFFLN